MSIKTKSVLCLILYNVMGQNSHIITITILTTSFGNCLFVHHLVLKHLLRNVIRPSFCIPKVIRIGAYKGANYSPKITILVNLGTLLNNVFTLLNKVFGPQKAYLII